MKSGALHRFYGRHERIRRLAMNIHSKIEFAALNGHKDAGVLDFIRDTRRQRESLLSAQEAFMVHSLARAQASLDGDMAEVGVYQGCSARLISTASGGRPLHLFDTFEGLPEPGRAETSHLCERQYRGPLEQVRGFLADRPSVSFYKGFFPDTAGPVADRRFSFVHLDVDLKSSTRDCLEFFYPRMVPGGVILTHDYSYLTGVQEAFTEFLHDRPERAIELPTSQAMLVCVGKAAQAAPRTEMAEAH